MSNRWAVLIGVNGYHESLGPLRYCTNDARLMHETLASECCAFPPDNIVLLTDDQPKDRQPTFGNIHSWLGTWLCRPGPDDLVLVFFAGHGREANGQALLAPLDATLDSLPVTGIPIQYVRDMLDRCRAAQKVLILDACHSGAGRDVATMSTGFREALDAGKGLYTIASCDADQISYEWPEKKQGVFTHYIAEAIRHGAPVRPDGRVSLDRVYEWAREGIVAWTAGKRLKQEPVRICRLKGDIHIASRPLSLEQRLAAAEDQVRAQTETIYRLRSEVEGLSNENISLRGDLEKGSKGGKAGGGSGTLRAAVFPGDARVEYYLDDELSPGLGKGLKVEAGSHKVVVVPKSMCWGVQETNVIVPTGGTTRMALRLRRTAHWRPLGSVGAMCICPMVFALAYQQIDRSLTSTTVAWLYLWSVVDLLVALAAAFTLKGLRYPGVEEEADDDVLKWGALVFLSAAAIAGGAAALMGLSAAAWHLGAEGGQGASALITAAVHMLILGPVLLAPFPASSYRTRGI